MNKELIKKYVLSAENGKYLYYALSFFISAGIAYYAYNNHLKSILDQLNTVKTNMQMLDKQTLEDEIAKLKKEKTEKEEEHRFLRDKLKEFEALSYKDTYSVVVDVLSRLNGLHFNLYDYKINEQKDSIEIKMNGSYINLIRFFDFLETIKANVEIEAYKVFLKDNKMVVELKLKIGVLSI